MIKYYTTTILLFFPLIGFSAQTVTTEQLLGVWNVENIPWSEKYEFKSDSTVLYIVKGKPRKYTFKLVDNEIIIQREMGLTINRVIESFDGKIMEVKDKDFGMKFKLKKEN